MNRLEAALRAAAGDLGRCGMSWAVVGGLPCRLRSKAGGFGLNLTEADYVFMMGPWWNPATDDQAIDRTHRIGQTQT